MATTKQLTCEQALMAYLQPNAYGLGLPTDAVPRLGTFEQQMEGITRVAVLDRKVGGATWEQLGDEVGVSPQAIRQRYVRRMLPQRADDLEIPKNNRDEFYKEFPELAEGWGWEPGDHSRGEAPFGVDYRRITDDDENSWMITICTPAGATRIGVAWGRFGTDADVIPCVVTASALKRPILVLSRHRIPLGLAARALNTIPRKCEPDEVAAAIGDQGRREKHLEHLLTTWRHINE